MLSQCCGNKIDLTLNLNGHNFNMICLLININDFRVYFNKAFEGLGNETISSIFGSFRLTPFLIYYSNLYLIFKLFKTNSLYMFGLKIIKIYKLFLIWSVSVAQFYGRLLFWQRPHYVSRFMKIQNIFNFCCVMFCA